MRIRILLALTVALAFSIRVIPSWQFVMTPDRVTFQDNDSWSHMHAVQDAAAHFPRQSTFNPYGLFPQGQDVQVDRWDLALAGVAWILGAGKPGTHLVDLVGASVPALLGALLTLPLFFLGRRLFGETAGLLGAIAVAVIPGTLFWETHLGVPDHHVAECWLSFLSLLFLCKASDSESHSRLKFGAYAGLALGAYLCVRPAGIFVPAIFAIAALIEVDLALPVMVAMAAGSLTYFLCSGLSRWALFTWLSLLSAFLLAALAWGIGELGRRKQWRRSVVLAAEAACLAIAGGALVALHPAAFSALIATIRFYTAVGHTSPTALTAELEPLWPTPPGGFTALFWNFSIVWVIALSGLILLAAKVWREKRPALTVFAIWTVVMIVGGFIQIRMTLYTSPVFALLAGAGAAWAIDRIAVRNTRIRIPAIAALAAVVISASFIIVVRTGQFGSDSDPNWNSALNWLARNSPEPMPDPSAWTKLWTRPPNGRFPFPPSAYGVLTWWDYGNAVSYLTHRIPNSNGEQTNAGVIAQFLTTTDTDRARSLLSKLGTRYIIVDPTIVTKYWHPIVNWTGGDDIRYRRTIIAAGPDGKPISLLIYLPEFYQSMASRLYIFDGKAALSPKVSVFVTRKERTTNGIDYDALISVHEFPSREKAQDFMSADTSDDMILGSADPTETCVDFEALPWAKRVFTSDTSALREGAAPTAVKVFEVAAGTSPR